LLARAAIKPAPKDFDCEPIRIDDLPVYNWRQARRRHRNVGRHRRHRLRLAASE
jgi:hypothetical protein